MTKIDNKKQRQYMALAPLTSLAGIFIDPMASTLAPLVLYFIFRNKRPDVGVIALRTADLAFSIQLWLVLISLAFMLAISLNIVLVTDVQQMMGLATIIILAIFVVSLATATYQATRGNVYRYPFSFRIAERVLNLVDKRRNNN